MGTGFTRQKKEITSKKVCDPPFPYNNSSDNCCYRYRLSSGTDASSSEDERYDAREAKIFRRTADGASSCGKDVGGQRSTVGVAKGKGKAGDSESDSAGQRSTVVVKKGGSDDGGQVGVAEEGPVEGQRSGVGVAEEEEPYGASTDEEGDGMYVWCDGS